MDIGGRFSLSPTGALTITGVQPGDADTYTLSVNTPITTENSVPASTAQTVLTVLSSTPSFTSESWTGGVFTGHFTGPSGVPYHVLTSPDVTAPVSAWTSVASGTFSGGDDTATDSSASGSQQFYIITVP